MTAIPIRKNGNRPPSPIPEEIPAGPGGAKGPKKRNKIMKFNILKYGVLALLIAAGTVACSDDDTLLKPEPSPIVDPELPSQPALEIGTELFDLKKGSSLNQEIASGAGDYRVNVLDPKIASASVEGNTIVVKGLDYGTTEILVSDRGGSYRTVKTNVYLSDELVLSMASIELTLPMGAAADGSFTIDAGNPPYSVESAAREIASATLAADGTTVNVRGLGPGETTITVTDSRGLSRQVAVVNTATDSPFSEKELEAIKNAATRTCVINGEQVTGGSCSGGSNNGNGKPAWGIWSFNFANGRELYLSPKDGQWIDLREVKAYDGLYVYYREKKQYILTDTSIDAHAEVIKSESNVVWITFWAQKEEKLYKGYIVVTLDK